MLDSVEELIDRHTFLAATDVVDWRHPEVQSLARRLARGEREHMKIAQRCFEWVRDEIQHCMDFDRAEVTCKASEVLAQGTGFCYAKSHLLAALLRANGIPAGFCYQRLSLDGNGPPFCLHGLNAVWLTEFGLYRVDARGNKPGVTAEFAPPVERLAFSTQIAGEEDVLGIFAEPLPEVVQALRQYDNARLLAANLPDLCAASADERA
jgi:transglutaminase-like putative cysteine protease